MAATPAGIDLFPKTTDKDWHDLLVRSVCEPVIDGVEMPRFPHGRVQRGFVGSADEQTLGEAFNFWCLVKDRCESAGRPINASTRFLDFGSAWGRYTRYFWRDIPESNLYGVDIDPEIVATCRHLGVPGTFQTIDARGRLPFDDGEFDLLIAYSVFTNLPEQIADHWMQELSRVAKPGAIFVYTVEPRRFLTFIEGLDPASSDAWHALMVPFQDRIPALLSQFDSGGFCYIPSSGGAYRDADIYGDAAIPDSYIREKWGHLFMPVEYLDDANRFWQAVMTARKA